jgi:hypothetical protein
MSDRLILGIDPGAQTGIAVFKAGALWKLETIEPHQIADYLTKAKPARVIFEDSRLTSFMFTQVKSRPAALKMARNVGEIDAWCRLITSVCGDLGIAAHGISPKAKGAKVGAQEFARLTGWLAQSNEHTRDAAMVAFPYRRAA